MVLKSKVKTIPMRLANGVKIKGKNPTNEIGQYLALDEVAVLRQFLPVDVEATPRADVFAELDVGPKHGKQNPYIPVIRVTRS